MAKFPTISKSTQLSSHEYFVVIPDMDGNDILDGLKHAAKNLGLGHLVKIKEKDGIASGLFLDAANLDNAQNFKVAHGPVAYYFLGASRSEVVDIVRAYDRDLFYFIIDAIHGRKWVFIHP